MFNYTSQRTVDCSNPLTFSFDIMTPKIKLGVSLKNSVNETPISMLIDNNVSTGEISEIIENTLNTESNHENDTFCGEKVIINANESDSSDRPILDSYNDNLYTFNGSLNDLSNGSMIFFLTDSPKTDNYITSSLGTFELKNPEAHEIIPIIAEIEDDTSLMLNLDKNSISFLLLGNEIKRDFSKCPTTIYEKITNHDGIVSETTEYQNTKEIINVPYRIRFVISNDGRMISFSQYDKESKTWKCIRNHIFDIPKLKGEYKIVFSTDKPQMISNITSNF